MFAFRRSDNTFSIHEDRKLKIDPDWLSFLLRFNWKVYQFKNFFTFIVFSLSLHKCRKSLSKTTLMSLNWKVLTGWESLHQRNNSFREHNTLLSKHMQPSSFYTYNTAHAEHRWPLWYNDRIFSYQQKSWTNQSINQFYLKSLRGIKVALSIQAGGSCIKRTTKIKLKSKMRLEK